MTITAVTAADPEAASADLVAENLQALKALFPDAFTEGKVDFEVLRQLLGDVVEDGEERYGLTWNGKRQARRLALTPSMGTLRPAKADSVDWDGTKNLVIEGDNLEALKLLQKSYAGKVRLIYIDPPYNTGGDFIYADDYVEPLRNYLNRTGQINGSGVRNISNPESSGRYHTDWLNMLYPRLLIARQLLCREGAIFVSSDDYEIHNLRTLMDDVFGPENFIAIVSAVTNMKGRNDKKHIATAHEYILIYGQRDFVSYGFPLTPEQRSQFDQLDEFGRPYAWRDLRKRGGPDRREDRPKMHFPIFWDESTGRCSLVREAPADVEIYPKRGDGSDGRWRWGRETVERHLPWLTGRRSERTGRLDVQHRVYLDPSVKLADVEGEEADSDEEGSELERSSKPKSIWIGGEYSTDTGKRALKELIPDSGFDFPKSVELIRNVVVMSTTGTDIILDFFAGSGTTGHAVMAQNAADGGNRRYILVQLPEPLNPANKDQKIAAEFCDKHSKPRNIAELTKERLRRAAAKIRAENPDAKADLGFRVYKLAESNLKAWRPGADLARDLLDAADNLVSGRTEEDLLVELLLKRGIDLAERELSREIAGRAVHVFGGGTLAVCLAEVRVADAEALADGIADWLLEIEDERVARSARLGVAEDGKRTGAYIFFRDSGFQNDVAKANVEAILRQRLNDRGSGKPDLLDQVRSV